MTSVSVSFWTKKVNSVLNVSDPVWKAWRAMKASETNVLPVISNDKIVGLISGKDIVQASNHNGGQSMSVHEAMSLDPLVVNINTEIIEVAKFMIKKDQQNAVVVDESKNIIGVLSWVEVIHFFLEQNQIESVGLIKEFK